MIDLNDLTSNRLRNVAHSTGIDLEGATKKEEIIERLADEKGRLTEEGWKHGDETFELKEQVSRHSDTNILYGFQRAGATDERMEEIQELFQDTQYEFQRLDETDTGKNPFKIVIPAEE